MPVKASDENPEKARRFREAALPYLDDAYTLARYCCAMPPMPKTRCRNVTCARSSISTAIAGRR